MVYAHPLTLPFLTFLDMPFSISVSMFHHFGVLVSVLYSGYHILTSSRILDFLPLMHIITGIFRINYFLLGRVNNLVVGGILEAFA